jgi:hypothetical protein
MNAAERAGCATATVLVALATACSTLPAPREWIPTADEAPQSVLGAWTNVRHGEGKQRVTTSGELIAVSQDSIILATPDYKLASVAWNDVDRVQVAYFDPMEGACYGLGMAGALSSLSHGWLGVFSFPIWLIIGSAGGSGRVGEAVFLYPRETEDWRELRPYARFPQGFRPQGFRPAADSTIVAERKPLETRPVPSYQPPEKVGSGILFGGGFFEQGKGAWSVGANVRVKSELFATGGFTNFDDDAFDMEQWWAGARIGLPFFAGIKYIHTTQTVLGHTDSGDGWSVFGGFLFPTSEHLGVGLMMGYDDTSMDSPWTEDFWWAAAVLQLTLRPAD